MATDAAADLPAWPLYLLSPSTRHIALTMDLTGGEGRWGQARGAMGRQRRSWAWPGWGPAVRVHGQLVPKGFFFAPVGKPVVDTHLRDKVGTQPLCLRW